jgi:hypothetical protein
MKPNTVTHLSLAISALIFAAGALAQAPTIPDSAYRKNQPDVLVADKPANPMVAAPAFNSAAFTAAYRKAGSPNMVVLWNREFSDMLQQSSASQISIDTTRSGNANVTREAGPGWSTAESSSSSRGNTTITARDTKTVQAQRGGPIERVNLQMRSSFVQTIVSAGVRLVDRNLVMRTTATTKKGELDSQDIETSAFVKHAKLLMEVLNTPDSASPTGWATFVSVKRLTDGVVLMEGYMDGNLPEGAAKPMPKFEADPRGGFREVSAPATSVSEVGSRVAQQTLGLLSQAMAR